MTSIGERVRSGTLRAREARLGWLLTLPAALIVFALILFPIIWNVGLSLRRVRLIELRSLNLFGLDGLSLTNFARVTGVSDFWATLNTTLVYTIASTLLATLMGLWAAMAVRNHFRGRAVVRGLMLFPYVVPVVALALVTQLMLNPTFGIINEWKAALGGTRTDFLGTTGLALPAVVAFEGYRYFPFAFLFILARIQAIPRELEEAAEVDGATISQRFRYVILPQLRPVLSVLLLLRFIWTFNKFDDIYLLTGGAAGTKVVTVQIIEWLRGRADIGSAAALGLLLAAVMAVFLLVYFRFFYQEEAE